MKIQALLLATLVATPAAAEVINVHNADGSITRVQATSDSVIDASRSNVEAQANIEASRPLTPAEQRKLEAAERAPIAVTEEAHIRAAKKAAAEGADVNLETSAGSNVNYQDRGLTGYQDPYLSNSRAYRANENGEAAAAPSENIFFESTDGTRHEDRSNAVVTGTKSFLYR